MSITRTERQMSITQDELRKIPYLDIDAIGDRLVNLMPLWDGRCWHLWSQSANGLTKVTVIDAIKTDYVAKAPAKETDLLIPFVEFMWQHASWPELCPKINAICNDFHNLATCVAKIRHFFCVKTTLGSDVASSFVTTETEYLITLARGVFDLLQEAIATVWSSRIRYLDPAAEKYRKARSLPSTFSKMVLKDKQRPKSNLEIQNEYGLPPTLANEYAEQAEFFSSLRDTRDAIVHSGADVSTIFVTEKGFCVRPKSGTFAGFDGWNEEHRYNENLVSMMPWIAYAIFNTISACSAIMAALATEVRFPAAIAPGYRVLVRGPNNEALIDLIRIQQGGSPWWSETEETPQC